MAKTKTKTQTKTAAAVTLTNGRAFAVLRTLNGWREIRFVDTMVAVRANRLRTYLTAETKPVSEEVQAEFGRIREEHGVMRAGTKGQQKVLPQDSEGAQLFAELNERVMNAGEIEVSERFTTSELRVRSRDPETHRVSEYELDLSLDDIEALGEGELLEIVTGGPEE